jgi:hypothetical protein
VDQSGASAAVTHLPTQEEASPCRTPADRRGRSPARSRPLGALRRSRPHREEPLAAEKLLALVIAEVQVGYPASAGKIRIQIEKLLQSTSPDVLTYLANDLTLRGEAVRAPRSGRAAAC